MVKWLLCVKCACMWCGYKCVHACVPMAYVYVCTWCVHACMYVHVVCAGVLVECVACVHIVGVYVCVYTCACVRMCMCVSMCLCRMCVVCVHMSACGVCIVPCVVSVCACVEVQAVSSYQLSAGKPSLGLFPYLKCSAGATPGLSSLHHMPLHILQ